MSAINTSSEIIHDAVILCSGILEILSASQKEIQRKYKIAGSDWRDSKYQQLGNIVDECSASVQITLNDFHQCLASLSQIEQSILGYESINIISSNMPITSSVAASHFASNSDFLGSSSELKLHVEELKVEYYNDLANRSEYPNTITDNGGEWNRIGSAENAEMREEFDEMKRNLIAQWENAHGVSWPTYLSDVYTESGARIRKIGDRYDAHHIHPLTFGGVNNALNITPIHALEHFDKRGIHAPDSPYGSIERLIGVGI